MFRVRYVASWDCWFDEEPSECIMSANPLKVPPAVWRNESKEEVMVNNCASARDTSWVAMTASKKYDSK